jgi:hypothetical protein
MNSKTSFLTNYNLSNKIILYLIFLFPLIIVLSSETINIILTFICTLFLVYHIKKLNTNFLKNRFSIFFIAFFFYLFISTIIHNQDFILVLKSRGNYRYLILSIIVCFVLCIIYDKFKKIFIYFNCFLITFVGFNIFYQFFFSKRYFWFFLYHSIRVK